MIDNVKEIIDEIGKAMDLAKEKEDFIKTKSEIEKAKDILKIYNDDLEAKDAGKLNYFIAVAYGDIYENERKIKANTNLEEDINEQILYYKKALSYFSGLKDNETKNFKCMVLTNLGNLLNSVGRFVCANEFYEKALKEFPLFFMSAGNKGICIFHYALLLYDLNQTDLFMHRSYELLDYALQHPKDLHKEAKDAFSKYKNIIENKLTKEHLQTGLVLKKYSLGNSKEEIEYRKWCLDNVLFLNPLNDVINHNIVTHDILSTPSITTSIDECGLKYQGFFNQLKQEYVSARYTFYESINRKDVHFSDKDVFLTNTLDYPRYSLSIEKMKYAFRAIYSIFDKIAYFINSYFDIGIQERDVSFRSVWIGEKKGKNGYMYKRDLKKLFVDRPNRALEGMYWLSKDIFENTDSIIDPDAIALSDLRNHLEHKYLKVHEMLIKQESILKDDLAFSILEYNFEDLTLKLVKKARAAIIYLSLSIHIEEKHRNEDNPNIAKAPIFLDRYDDKWKR